jgi:hexosaminidase
MRHAIVPLLLTLGLAAVPASAPAPSPTPDQGLWTPDSSISIIPRPSLVTPLEGTCTLTDPLPVLVENDGGGELRETVAIVREFLHEKTGFRVTSEPATTRPAIVFELATSAESGSVGPEGYALTVSPSGIRIAARTADGAFWAFQTLRQLLPPEFEGGRRQAAGGRRRTALIIPAVHIVDAPRFAWRGSMLDVGRHFFTPGFVKRYIDLLALHKMNVFHWHLTEDQGWRIEIARYPRLTSVGAWRTEPDGTRYGGFYTSEEIRDVVEYARRRHVTVVPEIEMPGHATAAVVAYPELGCTGDVRAVPTTWGVHDDVYCAGKEGTYRFIETVLDEVMALFPSKVIHVGGDEVPKTHWKACPICQQRMRDEHLKDESELQSYFVKRIDAYVRGKGREITGWDEILEGGLAPGAMVQVWRDIEHTRTTVKLGNRVIASPASFTYLNRSPAELTLAHVFAFDPIPDGVTEEEARRILGGEAPVWTEGITDANFDQMVFPRLAAMAEALWSGRGGRFAEFKARLDAAYYPRLAALGVAHGPEAQALLAIKPTFDPRSLGVGLRIDHHLDGLEFRYTTDLTRPTMRARPFRPGTTFTSAGTVRVQPFLNGKPTPLSATLAIDRHLAVGKDVAMTVPNSAKYPGTGPFTLTDSLRGSIDFHDGVWQGWEGDDMEAVVDLGRQASIREVELTALQEMRSWILLPRRVSMWLSDDRVTWRPIADLTHDVPAEREEPLIYRFRQSVPAGTRARYIKVHALNAGPLPAWHPGAGGKAWIFVDEVVVR